MSKDGRFLLVFCDESRQFSDHYMVIGGIVVNRNYEPKILQAIQDLRIKNKYNFEFKWQKISKSRLSVYKGLVDLFFDHHEYIHFKSIVVDTHQYVSKQTDKELGFYKLMYQFLLHSIGDYLLAKDRIIINLDKRTTKYYKLSTLWAILNNGVNKKYQLKNKPIRYVRALDSKAHDLIQLADVIMGAIGYEMNGLHTLNGASKAKINLAMHIAKKAGLPNLRQNTPRSLRHFSIWQFLSKN